MVSKNPRHDSIKYTPTSDAGLGLVFRLNRLWAQADYKCLSGDFDGWNFVMDRIFCNLCYREKLEVEEEKKSGNVTNFKINEPNVQIYKIFSQRIKKSKEDYFKAIKIKSLSLMTKSREDHYQCLMEKDMWLRKFMADLGLYLKEYEYNPATALFGGG